MAILQIPVERFSVVSAKPFADVLAYIEAAVGHPDMRQFGMKVASAKTLGELEQVVNAAVGPSGFMEFVRINHGQFLEKAHGAHSPQTVRLVVGNPLIMMRMAKHVQDAGSYAPVTILVDERPDGVHISYDRMGSFLAPYGNLAALTVARELDAKVESLLYAAAG